MTALDPTRHPITVDGQGASALVDPVLLSWGVRARPLTLGLRLEEIAAFIHPMARVKIGLTLLTALGAALVLPGPVCLVWATVCVTLELWCWFVTRPPAADRRYGGRDHAAFFVTFSAIIACWLMFVVLIWISAAPQGHAIALVMATTLGAICLLLFHKAPWTYLVAGAAPWAASTVYPDDGRDWRQMAPIWLMLGLSAMFCLGRALRAPSAQQSLRRVNESLRNFEVLAANVTDVITRSDLNGVLQYISPGCLGMLGYRPDELIGGAQRDHHHPDNLPAIVEAMNRMAADPSQSVVVTLRVRHKDGRWVWIQSNAKQVCEDGVPVGVIEVSRDVTAQVAAEVALRDAKIEAEAANQAKAEFLANVSHEIRTPMNGVLGALHLLSHEPISAEGRELMRQANDCGRMLSQLLNDVLDFSKIDAGQLEMAPEPMRPGEALEAVINLLGGQARAKGLDLRCEVVGDDQWIEADPVRLRQVMFNLLGNALKFTARGHVIARLAVTQAGEGRRHVRLEVEDTGIGMNPEAQSHLFERFRQAEGDTARRFGGTGLGLSISQALAHMMGGEITFVSVEGEGSTFRMALEAPAAAPVAAEPVEEGLLEGVNILLVEDNPTNRLVARTMLSRLGASVDEAEDGLAGVEAARRGAHDLILMDIQMPHMDGVEATRTIRGLVGAVAAVPIIGLTANVMVHQRAEYVLAGMNGVVAKPISPGALISEIARVISTVDEAPAPSAADMT